MQKGGRDLRCFFCAARTLRAIPRTHDQELSGRPSEETGIKNQWIDGGAGEEAHTESDANCRCKHGCCSCDGCAITGGLSDAAAFSSGLFAAPPADRPSTSPPLL